MRIADARTVQNARSCVNSVVLRAESIYAPIHADVEQAYSAAKEKIDKGRRMI